MKAITPVIALVMLMLVTVGSYPGVEGKHIVRVATSSNTAEVSVTC